MIAILWRTIAIRRILKYYFFLLPIPKPIAFRKLLLIPLERTSYRQFMKKILLYLSLGCLFLSSCSHRIIRTGYEVNKSEYRYCPIEIVKTPPATDSEFQKLGEIKLGESGFSSACSEEHAMHILKGEGCALGAHLIFISEEKLPNVWSTCYRCTATFYRFTDQRPMPEIAEEEPDNQEEEYLRKELSDQEAKNTGVFIISFIIGFAIGLLLVL